MKKITLLLMNILFICSFALAQLSGNYTIGGSNPDYATIQSAITALQVNGVNGAVTFNIRSGTYSGKVSMGNVNGASSVNTITFQAESGDSSDVILSDSSSSSSSSNFTVLVNGTDYLTLQHLTLERIGSNTYASVLYIGSGSRSFQLKNCIVRSGITQATSNTSSLIYMPLGNAADSNLVFVSNVLEGGAFGMDVIGQGLVQLIPGMRINDNTFINNSYRGMFLNFHSGTIVHSNNIISNSANSGFAAMELQNVNDAIDIRKNKIIGSNGSGILLSACIGQQAAPGVIANNFISISGNASGAGLLLDASQYQYVLYNSVWMNQTGAGSAAFMAMGSGFSDVTVSDNILMKTGSGLVIGVDANASTGFTNSDYNDLYAPPGDTSFGSWNGAAVAGIINWRTASGLDGQSVSADPQFVSFVDLHAGSPLVNDIGIPFTDVTDDIDGESRSLTNSDIGADEFTPLDANVGVLAILEPGTGECGNTTTRIVVLIKNFGQLPQSNFDIKASVSGAVTTTLSETYVNTLGPNTPDTVRFTQTIDTYAGGTIDVTAWSELGGDQYLLNDTVRGSYDFSNHPNPPVVTSPQQQCNTNVQITAQPDSGDALAWYADASGGDPLFVGPVFSPAITGDTTFYVETRSGSGSSGCLRITEIEPEGTVDYVEIQNLSGGTLNATGWKVYASNDYTDINLVNANSWDLGIFAPGETQYRTDGTTDNYWGSNLLWSANLGGWALILDDHGTVVDFVAWDWDSTSIQNLNVNLNGFPVSIGSEWSGDGTLSCQGGITTISRSGIEDYNVASDFICDTASKGIHNAHLDAVLHNCGIGLCGSMRIPVDITLINGVTTNLGNDTALTPPFSFPLDAGAGFSSYVWSDGSTTQSISVTAPGIYWVTVEGGNGCTFTDSITISIPVAVGQSIAMDAFTLSPNPASHQLVITGNEVFRQALQFRLLDVQGRELIEKRFNGSGMKSYTIDLGNVNPGMYFIQMFTQEGNFVKRFNVIR